MKRNTESGFTLVELLIVLALTGIMAVAVVNLFRLMPRYYNQVQPQAEEEQSTEATLNFIARELRAAAMFSQDSDAVTLIFQDNSGNQITYALNSDRNLTRTQAGTTSVLLNDVSSWGITYFSSVDATKFYQITVTINQLSQMIRPRAIDGDITTTAGWTQ